MYLYMYFYYIISLHIIQSFFPSHKSFFQYRTARVPHGMKSYSGRRYATVTGTPHQGKNRLTKPVFERSLRMSGIRRTSGCKRPPIRCACDRQAYPCASDSGFHTVRHPGCPSLLQKKFKNTIDIQL